MRKKYNNTKWLESESEDSEALPLFSVQDHMSSQPPIDVTMSVMNTPVIFELDTGAVVTVIPEQKI